MYLRLTNCLKSWLLGRLPFCLGLHSDSAKCLSLFALSFGEDVTLQGAEQFDSQDTSVSEAMRAAEVVEKKTLPLAIVAPLV
jgi:hypothetical protein